MDNQAAIDLAAGDGIGYPGLIPLSPLFVLGWSTH